MKSPRFAGFFYYSETKIAATSDGKFWGMFGANGSLDTVLGQFGVSPISARNGLIRRALTVDCNVVARRLSWLRDQEVAGLDSVTHCAHDLGPTLWANTAHVAVERVAALHTQVSFPPVRLPSPDPHSPHKTRGKGHKR
jgi:hypothetical protein